MVANCGHGYCYFGLRYRFWFCWLSQPLIAFYPRMRTEGHAPWGAKAAPPANDAMRAEGCILENYRQNPIVLAHTGARSLAPSIALV
jgi:hypothetical protein